MINRRELANSLRMLSIDAIQKANSGHPGMPMGMADIAEVLWNDFLKHNPANVKWPNRDRFIVSNGHGSMLHYALLHLSGYAVSIEDLKQFRQLHSKTPGHPEYGVTPGVEVTTGPLGQGLASAVGMALAERLLANRFNRDAYQIVDNYTYCFVGDGCLMEGVSHEACSLAGTLELGKLIVFWDENEISLDGPVMNSCADDVGKRFAAYNWHVIPNINGHDPEAIKKAIINAKQMTNKPSLICCKTTIGFGSPNLAGKSKCHGAPLGEEETMLVREALAWKFPPFFIPEDIYNAWDAKSDGEKFEQNWRDSFHAYERSYPYLAAEFERRIQGELPLNWRDELTSFIGTVQQTQGNIATREASRNALDFIGEMLPELIGGAADLAGPTFTMHKTAKTIMPGTFSGNYINYGVREFAMACIMNGLSLYGGFIPYGGTFLTFSDYARAAFRLAAIMKKQTIYVLTHDSIAIGEDGITHQPIEHLAVLRMMPNLSLWRPADAVETAVAWQMAIENRNGPTVLALTKQQLNCQVRNPEQIEQIKQGGYIIADCKRKAEVILIATGSELNLALQAAAITAEKGHLVRVVSMPSTDVFLAQPQAYKDMVLPQDIPKVVIEAGVTTYWYQFIQGKGRIIGLDHYGVSAPGPEVYKYFNMTVEAILGNIYEVLGIR